MNKNHNNHIIFTTNCHISIGCNFRILQKMREIRGWSFAVHSYEWYYDVMWLADLMISHCSIACWYGASRTCENVQYWLISKSIKSNNLMLLAVRQLNPTHSDFFFRPLIALHLLRTVWSVRVNEFFATDIPMIKLLPISSILITWHWLHRVYWNRTTRSSFHLFHRHRTEIIIRLTWFLSYVLQISLCHRFRAVCWWRPTQRYN